MTKIVPITPEQVTNALARMSKDPNEQSAALVREAETLALSFLEWAEGDVEVVRAMWTQAFEDAERIDHNQSLDDARRLTAGTREDDT